MYECSQKDFTQGSLTYKTPKKKLLCNVALLCDIQRNTWITNFYIHIYKCV